MAREIVPYQKQTAMGYNNSVKKKPEVKDEPLSPILHWLKTLENTLRWRQINYDKDWTRAYNMFNGSHWRDKMENDPSSDNVSDRITVNITMSTILNIVPFLLSQKPKFVCKPRKPEKDKVAILQSEILNYEYEQREVHNQVKKSVYDCVIVGHGIIKIGYALEIDKAEKKKDGVIQYESYIKEDSPYAKRICPHYFLIDPQASENNLETAEWCAEILFQSKRNICANTRYDSSVRKKIANGEYELTTKANYFGNLSDASIASGLKSSAQVVDQREDVDDEEPIVLFELWSKRERAYYILSPGIDEPLLKKPWPFDYIDNFPYIKVDYIPIQDDLYGVGIPYTIEDQQFELNRVRTSAFEHRRRFNRKYLALENQISPSEANKLVNGPDGTVVFIKQAGAIYPLEEANLQRDNIEVEGMIKGDVGQMTGNDDLISGRTLPSRTTQGEVNTRTSLFRLKLDDRAESIDKFVLNVGKQLLQHIKNNFRTDRIIGIFGLAGVNWETLTPSDIKEEVDVSMETLAAPKTDPTTERQQRAFVWEKSVQAFPLVQYGLLKIDYNNLYAWMMESFGYKDIGRFFDFSLVVQPPLQQVDGTKNNSINENISLTPTNQTDIMQQAGNNSVMGELNGMFNFG